jgi:hypothetical protein
MILLRKERLYKMINYEVKEKMVSLPGACFWFWNSFYSFLDSCGVSKTIQSRYSYGETD